jgi:hypothetical protein
MAGIFISTTENTHMEITRKYFEKKHWSKCVFSSLTIFEFLCYICVKIFFSFNRETRLNICSLKKGFRNRMKITRNDIPGGYIAEPALQLLGNAIRRGADKSLAFPIFPVCSTTKRFFFWMG